MGRAAVSLVAMPNPEPIRARTFQFALEIVRFYRKLTTTTDVPGHLARQMLRAGTSIGSNVEEAKSAYSRRELASKYSISLREARECHYWLRLIRADQPQLAQEADRLIEECNQLIAILTTIVRKLVVAKIRDSATVIAGVLVMILMWW
jgi:four helix bundle protein